MNSIKITPPAKPETQTARMALNLTPTLKERVFAGAAKYDTSANSLVCQLVAAGLDLLEQQEAEAQA